MKLILHHLAKDLRAQRGLLLFALLIILLRIGIDLLELQPDYHLASGAEFVRNLMVLPLSGALLWTVLLVRLIQSEPVTGQTSFWLTRPVPRSVYIPSKFIFIVLFLTIPYLVPVPLDMFHLGLGPGRILAQLRESLLLDFYCTVIVLWLATYTRNLPQFFFMLVVFVLGLTAIIAGLFYGRSFLKDSSLHAVEIMTTRWALFVLLLFGGLMVSLLIPHIRRKESVGFGLGVSFMALATLVLFFFPISFGFLPPTWLIPLATSTTSQTSVTLKYTDDWQQRLSWMRNDQTQEWIALSAFTPATATGPQVPIIETIGVTFKAAGEQPRTLSNGVRDFPTYMQYDVERAIAADLPGVRFTNLAGPQGGGSLSVFALDAANEKRLLGKTGTLDLSLFGYMNSLVQEAVIPLNGPCAAREPGAIIHIARLPRIPRPFVTDDTAEKPVLAVWTLGYMGQEQFEQPDRTYLLVDPQGHTGTFLHPDPSGIVGDGLVGITSKGSRHVYLSLAGDEPLDRMVLYVYEFKRGGFFNATLSAPNFPMNPEPKIPLPAR